MTVILLILALMLFTMLSAKEQRNFISDIVGTAGLLIKATWWISGLFVAPFFALIAAIHYNNTQPLDTSIGMIALVFAGIGFLFWKSLIAKLNTKETKK